MFDDEETKGGFSLQGQQMLSGCLSALSVRDLICCLLINGVAALGGLKQYSTGSGVSFTEVAMVTDPCSH